MNLSISSFRNMVIGVSKNVFLPSSLDKLPKLLMTVWPVQQNTLKVSVVSNKNWQNESPFPASKIFWQINFLLDTKKT